MNKEKCDACESEKNAIYQAGGFRFCSLCSRSENLQLAIQVATKNRNEMLKEKLQKKGE